MIAIGIGCRTACPAADIVALVRKALARLPANLVPGGMYSIDAKATEKGLAEAAEQLGLPLTFLDRAALRRVSGEAMTRSRLVEEMFGLPSVAETAALAGAGQGAVVLVPRLASSMATCAIAGPAPRAGEGQASACFLGVRT